MSTHLRVNPITCEAHGLCAELLPEMITLDDWGYPIVDGSPVAPELLEHAQRAAASCPTLALLIQRRQSSTERQPQERVMCPDPYGEWLIQVDS